VPLVVEAVMGTIRELKHERVSMLLVEQNAEMALRLADRVYVIDHGTIVFEGTPGLPESDLRRIIVERHGTSPSLACGARPGSSAVTSSAMIVGDSIGGITARVPTTVYLPCPARWSSAS